MGGLGNQLFQYAFAKNIKLNHGYDVEIETTWYDKEKKGCVNREYALDRLRCDIKVSDPLSKIRCKSVIHEDRDECVEIQDDTYYAGYWQNPNYFNSISKQIRKDFELKELDISNSTSDLKKEILASNSLSLHVRRTDYLENSKYYVCDTEYYLRAFEYIRKEHGECVCYVFSDDIGWCKENMNCLNTELHFIDTGDDLIDWYLMCQTRHHIIANSTYSWWAAWMNDGNGTVIMPQKWLQYDGYEELRCKNWIVM